MFYIVISSQPFLIYAKKVLDSKNETTNTFRGCNSFNNKIFIAQNCS